MFLFRKGGPVAQPTKIPEPWVSLANRYGGPTAFAAYLGVSYSTFYRWAHGYIAPVGENLALLDHLFKQHDLTRPHYTTLRPR
jgi:hypothetical protein